MTFDMEIFVMNIRYLLIDTPETNTTFDLGSSRSERKRKNVLMSYSTADSENYPKGVKKKHPAYSEKGWLYV